MADYKGIYYKDDTKQRYFEGGAHFKYIHLFRILEKLSSAQKIKLQREQLIHNKEIKKTEKLKKHKKPSELISKNFHNTNSVSTYFFIFIYFLLLI